MRHGIWDRPVTLEPKPAVSLETVASACRRQERVASGGVQSRQEKVNVSDGTAGKVTDGNVLFPEGKVQVWSRASGAALERGGCREGYHCGQHDNSYGFSV